MNMITNTPIHHVPILLVPGAATVDSPIGIIVAVEAGSVLSTSFVLLGSEICIVGIRVGGDVMVLGVNLKVHMPASNSVHHLAR